MPLQSAFAIGAPPGRWARRTETGGSASRFRSCKPKFRDYASNPLREALERDFGIRLVRARQVIRAILTPRGLAETLGIKPKSALLFIERVSYSQENVPVEFLRIYYRADRYILYNELQG